MSASLFPRFNVSYPATLTVDDRAWRDTVSGQPTPDGGMAIPSAASGIGTPALYVSGDDVMLREAPRPDATSIAGLPKGEVVSVVGQITGSWVGVRDAAGNVGFVASRFLSPNNPG